MRVTGGMKVHFVVLSCVRFRTSRWFRRSAKIRDRSHRVWFRVWDWGFGRFFFPEGPVYLQPQSNMFALSITILLPRSDDIDEYPLLFSTFIFFFTITPHAHAHPHPNDHPHPQYILIRIIMLVLLLSLVSITIIIIIR